MAKVDQIYEDLVLDIHNNGVWDKDQKVRTKYADGTPAYTKSIIGRQVVFEAEDFPLLTTKQVTYHSMFAELWWIWFERSNDVNRLNELGCTIWDEWKKEDGSIGTAYGYVLNKKVRDYEWMTIFPSDEEPFINKIKMNQVDYLINQIRENPNSRRHIVSLWSPEDLDGGSLEPCVWSSQWIVQQGKLNLIVNQRSADIALGVPYNWGQYKILQMIIAKLAGLEVGKMIWNFGHLHYYDRHEENLLKQIEGKQHNQPEIWLAGRLDFKYFIYTKNPTKEELKELIEIKNYKHNGKFTYEVAI